MDLKYTNQTFTLTVELKEPRFSAQTPATAREQFHRVHEASYGLRFAQEPIEIVNLRVSVVGTLKSFQMCKAEAGSRKSGDSCKGHRNCYFFGPEGGFMSCAVHDYSALGIGAVLQGPAIIEQENSTIIVPPGFLAKLDAYHNIIIGVQEWRA
jgi:N-methylhydantoinase A